MSRTKRIAIFLASLLLLVLATYFIEGSPFPRGQIPVLLFSALLMLSLTALILEHFFTTPTNVIASTVAVLLTLGPLHEQLDRLGIYYWIFFSYNAVMLIVALVALLLLDRDLGSAALQNRLSERLKRFATFFGNGRFIFATLFFLTLVFYVDSQSPGFLILSAYAMVIMLIDPKSALVKQLESSRAARHEVGEVIGVQSGDTFIARLFGDRMPVRKHAFVEFRYSQPEDDQVHRGMVLEQYLLNEKQWVKVLASNEISSALSTATSAGIRSANRLYLLPDQELPDGLKRFCGLIVERSTIGKIRFEFAGANALQEGDLVQVAVGVGPVLYQVVQGTTETEVLEAKNETGLIVAEAVQLGRWNPEKRAFEKCGWVPDMGAPVFLPTPLDKPETPEGEVEVGVIPGTQIPVFLNLQDAVTHHLAILGVTGSGKSVFSRKLIRDITRRGTRTICVDFTEECKTKLADLAPRPIFAAGEQTALFDAIDVLGDELDKFKNLQNKGLVAEKTRFLSTQFKAAIEAFLASGDQILLFELPDVANTTGILEYTRQFFKALFGLARARQLQPLCVILEEAHTVIPEWTFIGVDEKKAQSLVNSIGQIALQGRKYGVGFIVIAQRTANVSKTVLTQCNSIVAFQQFDKTSADFLKNYMGSDLVDALPNLRFRQAVAVGKAFRSGVPVIFEVPEIREV